MWHLELKENPYYEVVYKFLEYSWDEKGVVPDWETIFNALENKVTLSFLEYLDDIVNHFIDTIRKEEGIIEYDGEPKRRELDETSHQGYANNPRRNSA